MSARISVLIFLLMITATSGSYAQQRESPHQRDAREQPRAVSYNNATSSLARPAAVALTHAVHGYHPYWIPDAAADLYRFDLLSHLAYFSCEIDPVSGQPTNTRGWATSSVPARAKAAGVKVLLTVTNFGSEANRSLLGNPVARDTLCAALLRLVQLRDADGISIDFEAVPADQRNNLTTFFQQLRNTLNSWRNGLVISAATPAVDWSGSWDLAAIATSIDLFFIMGYDYSWSGSSSAGPVAPLRGFSLNVEKTVDWYLAQGAPASKVLLGVPYYGYDWPVEDDRQQSPATSTAAARIYSVIPGMLNNYPGQWNEQFSVPWIPYRPSTWRQLWYDDARSLAMKYQFVLDRNLAGTGMWALGYDGEFPELWTELERAFTRTTGIAEAPQPGRRFALWPLPLRSGERFSVTLEHAGEATISLHDMLGRLAHTSRIPAAAGLHALDLPGLPPGMYLARLVQSGGTSARLIIVE